MFSLLFHHYFCTYFIFSDLLSDFMTFSQERVRIMAINCYFLVIII